MPQLYDPSSEILKNLGDLLIADNTDPDAGNQIYAIHHFVQDRIFQSETLVQGDTLPRITMSFNSGPGQGNLPSEKGMLNIKVWYERARTTNFQTLCKWCSNRIIRLLREKPANLSSNKVIVRLVDYISCFYLDDPDTKTYYSSITFELTYKVSVD